MSQGRVATYLWCGRNFGQNLSNLWPKTKWHFFMGHSVFEWLSLSYVQNVKETKHSLHHYELFSTVVRLVFHTKHRGESPTTYNALSIS